MKEQYSIYKCDGINCKKELSIKEGENASIYDKLWLWTDLVRVFVKTSTYYNYSNKHFCSISCFNKFNEAFIKEKQGLTKIKNE